MSTKETLTSGNHTSEMTENVLARPTPKRAKTLKFEGRILYLADDSTLMAAQLEEGDDLNFTAELRAQLRDQISTDEITPAYICFFYDETLGDFPYLGLRPSVNLNSVFIGKNIHLN